MRMELSCLGGIRRVVVAVAVAAAAEADANAE